MSAATDVAETLTVRCCIVGGGPAGMMLGFLLARAGVDVIVLEKHADFLRDFRGDTIHPSTLEIMHELGLLAEFLKEPHQEVRQLSAQIGDTTITPADFTHLPTHCKFLAFMPQWDFLNFVATQARRYPNFGLRMEAQVTELVLDGQRVAGVRAITPGGVIEVRADLIVGADGRHSTVREEAGLEVMELGVPIDVLWMRLSRSPTDPGQVFGRFDYGKVFIMIDREDYFQCGLVIPKGGFGEFQQRGLAALREDIAKLVPFMSDRVGEIRDWSDIHVLTVAVDRLRQWFRPGLLCIGDAAHAMSPIGGVGINLAVQDAVAAANILAVPLRQATVSTESLQAVQRRRELPTRITQRLQVLIQDHLIQRVLTSNKPISPPWPLKLLQRWPILRRIPARILGMGFRPEHVRTPYLGSSGNRTDSQK
ncbi:MAG: FAD-dependent oxidoreductase [Desulfomonilaceae bacterium]